jgi:putative phosphoribosyl transferase
MSLSDSLNPTERIRVFRDRKEAGRLLADALSSLKDRKDVIVLAIPRGGVVVAKEVASKIHAPLDVIITRKIGAPMNPELAVGAVDDEGEAILDHDLVNMLGISPDYLRHEYERQTQEIRERAEKYRRNRPPPVLKGKTVVIVDDGIATGSTIRAAIRSVKKRGAARIIVAAPVGSPQAVSELSRIADQVVCLSTPENFEAIGAFYEDFEQVDDDTVREILATSQSTR